MSIILSALLALAAQDAAANEKAQEPAAKEAPIPEKIPAKAGEGNEPTVRIRTSDNGDIVEEYREGGVVHMVKVTPPHGKPYYLMDENGSGAMTRYDDMDSGLRVPKWVIFSFD